MEIRDIVKVFVPDTKISIENFNDVLFSGQIHTSEDWKESNLEVVECEIIENVLRIRVAM